MYLQENMHGDRTVVTKLATYNHRWLQARAYQGIAQVDLHSWVLAMPRLILFSTDTYAYNALLNILQSQDLIKLVIKCMHEEILTLKYSIDKCVLHLRPWLPWALLSFSTADEAGYTSLSAHTDLTLHIKKFDPDLIISP